MVDRINIKIGLDGGQQVEQQLTDIGKAGEDSFKQIEQAADDVDFKKIADTTTELKDQFKQLSEIVNQSITEFNNAAQATDKLAESQDKLSTEWGKNASEIAKNTAEVAKYGIEIGILLRGQEGIARSVANLALGTTEVTAGLGLLGGLLQSSIVRFGLLGIGIFETTKALDALGHSIAESTRQWIELVNQLKLVELNSGAIPNQVKRISDAFETLGAKAQGISFEQLVSGRDAFALLGISAEKFIEIAKKLSDAIKGVNVADQLKDSAKESQKALDDVLQAEKELLEQQLKLGTAASEVANLQRLAQIEAIQNAKAQIDAADKLVAAQDKAKEAAANTGRGLADVLDKIEAINQGAKGITFDGLVKADTIVKAFSLSLKDAANSGSNVTQVLIDFIRNADRAQALQVGKAFGVSEDQVDRIRRLNVELSETNPILDRIKAANDRLAESRPGELLSPDTVASLVKASDATDEITRAQERLNQALRSTIFTKWAADVLEAIDKVKAGFLNLAASIVESFNELPLRFDRVIETMTLRWAQFRSSLALSDASKQQFDQMAADAKAAIAEIDKALKGIGEGAGGVSPADRIARAFDTLNAFSKSDTFQRKVADLNAQLALLSQKEKDVADNIAKIEDKGLKQIEDAARRATEQMARLDDQISNVFRSIRQEGLQKGIIDPETFGPVAGREEEFAALMQKQARQVGDLERQKQQALDEEARRQQEIAQQIEEQVVAELKKLGVIQQQIEELKRLGAVQQGQGQGQQQATDQLPRAGETAAEFAARTAATAGVGATPPPVFDQLTQAFQEMLPTLNPITQAFTQMAPVLDPVTQGFTRLAPTLDPIATSFQNMSSVLDQVTEALRKIAQPAAPTPLTGGEPFALGGLLGGRPGTDTNLGWFTAGEFIMRRDAVRQWGVEFMHAINAGRNPFVGTIPQFAEGGLAGGGANVSIHFPGLPPISGLRASADTVAELQRAAAMAQVRSGGRKPSRYS